MKYKFIRFPGFRNKAVTLSYDDGNINDIKMTEILNRYGIKCTFNIPGTSFADAKGTFKVTAEEAKEIYCQNGNDVAIHGAQHMAPYLSSAKDGIREITDCRDFLEQFFGKIIRGLAFPDRGLSNPVIEEYLKMLGITYARTVNHSRTFDLPQNWLEWNMTIGNRDPQLMEYVDKFLTADPLKEYVCNRSSLLFAMWGHSFEFPGQGWDVLENFCEKIGGHDEVWYVNNTELYEYCHAFDSLVFSSQNTMVYNPTQITVYFEGSMKNYMVEPGQTLILD